MPGSSILTQVSRRKPGTASRLTPNCGTHQVWITSVEVSRMRTFLPTGSTTSVVHLEQVVFALGLLALDLVARGGQGADELDAGIGVFVLPFPLHAGDLEHHVGLGRVSSMSITAWKAGMPISTKSMKSRMAKGTSAQNHCSAPVGPLNLAGCMADALAVLDHRIDHDREHHHEQHGDDQHELVVDVQRVPGDGVTGFGKFQV
jgi:hypothetical protein